MPTPRRLLQSTLLLAVGGATAVAIAPPSGTPVAFVPAADETPAVTQTVTVTETETVTATQTVTSPPRTVTETVAVPGPTVTETVTAAPPPAVVPPPTTPAPPTGAELLADARRVADAKVVRLDPPAVTPGVVYVQPSIRTGRGRLTVDDEDVVPLLVLACPEADCDAGVSATVARRSRSGRPARTFRLRRATFSLDAGRMRLVAVRLTAPQRRAIRAARSATLRISLAVSGPGGVRSKRTLDVTLRVRAAERPGSRR